MKVTMKEREKRAKDFCEKFKKSWELSIVGSDSYLSGYRQAIKDCEKQVKKLTNLDISLNDVGTDPVEVEFEDGAHMLHNRE